MEREEIKTKLTYTGEWLKDSFSSTKVKFLDYSLLNYYPYNF